jgi:hypothetical protein
VAWGVWFCVGGFGEVPGGSVGLRGGGSALVLGTATKLHQHPRLQCRCCLRLRVLLRELPSVSLRLCADHILSGALLSRAGLRQRPSRAEPKLHPATPGSSKRLLSSLGPAPARNCDSFAALAAKNEELSSYRARRVLQIRGGPRQPKAHEAAPNIAAGQTLACGAERRASEGAAAPPSTRAAKNQNNAAA